MRMHVNIIPNFHPKVKFVLVLQCCNNEKKLKKTSKYDIIKLLIAEAIDEKTYHKTGGIKLTDGTITKIPQGYKMQKGVIYRISDGSSIQWIPIEPFLVSTQSQQKPKGFSDPDRIADNALAKAKQKGGFLITSFNLAKKKNSNEIVSRRGLCPLYNLDFFKAKQMAENFEPGRSYLPFGWQIDAINAWLIESGAKEYSEVYENSSSWGNYADARSLIIASGMQTTGSQSLWQANGLWDWAGNVPEWTQELFEDSVCGIQDARVLRGGSFLDKGFEAPAGVRIAYSPWYADGYNGCRAVIDAE